MIDDRGFAALETLVGTGFALLLMGAGLTTSYVSFARTWLDRNAYEAAICLASDSAAHDCERRTRDAVTRGLPIGALDSLHLQRTPARVSVRGRWRLTEDLILSFRDERSLPLRESR